MKMLSVLAKPALLAAGLICLISGSGQAAPAAPMTPLPQLASPPAAVQLVHYRRYHHCHTTYKHHCRYTYRYGHRHKHCYKVPVRHCHGGHH